MAETPRLPKYDELMWPVLAALKELGGSGTVQEIYEHVIENEHFTEAQQSVLAPDGRMTQIAYRLHWARTHLKKIGAVSNSARGVWAITDKGQNMTPEQVRAEHKEWRGQLRTTRSKRREEVSDELGATVEEDEPSWKDTLIDRLLALPPHGFERLAQRLLREAGFVNVVVTGRSGDGGLDGVGVYRLSLVSFPLYFQCKRYRGAVRAHAVRDFRGAIRSSLQSSSEDRQDRLRDAQRTYGWAGGWAGVQLPCRGLTVILQDHKDAGRDRPTAARNSGSQSEAGRYPGTTRSATSAGRVSMLSRPTIRAPGLGRSSAAPTGGAPPERSRVADVTCWRQGLAPRPGGDRRTIPDLLLRRQDSNLDLRNQNPRCCRYTTADGEAHRHRVTASKVPQVQPVVAGLVVKPQRTALRPPWTRIVGYGWVSRLRPKVIAPHDDY